MNGLTILSGISLIFISCFSIWTLGMIMEKDIADSTRHTVETAYGILGHYQKLEQQGTLSHEAARHQALEAIRTLRFNTSDYFWSPILMAGWPCTRSSPHWKAPMSVR
jgi:methyl-accepting chemotaxis protein